MDFISQLILKSCLLIELKNQMLPLTSIPNSRCRIRLDNLEFRRNSRDFSSFLGSPSFSDGLEVFYWGSLRCLFSNLCFDMIVMYFLHFEILHMNFFLFLFKFLFCKVCWSCFSHLLIWLLTLKMLQSCILLFTCFLLKKMVGYLLNYFLLVLKWLFVIKH
jgi:hypothetical protein